MESPPASGRIKTILLVDDGDECRVTTKWFLTNFGYAVDAVRSAEEALALFNPAIHDLGLARTLRVGNAGRQSVRTSTLPSAFRERR